ncbi:unnamed protein product, partial [Musa hybrid cultivar]
MPGQSPEAMHIRGQQFAHHRDKLESVGVDYLMIVLVEQGPILLIQRKTLRPARSKSSSLPPSFRSSSPSVHLQQRCQTTADFTARVQISLPSLPLQLLPECTAISAENGRVEKAVCSWQAVACADKLRYLVVALSLCSYAD